MILTFVDSATPEQREAVRVAVTRRGIGYTASDAALVLGAALAQDDALTIAAMPGVAKVTATGEPPATLHEAMFAWAAGAATVLGVLVLVAANLQATLGRAADPLRTPSDLRPSWPLIPWYAAVDKAPPFVPVPLLFVLAALVLFFWPTLGRRLAQSHPGYHTLAGIVALAAVAGLAVVEVLR